MYNTLIANISLHEMSDLQFDSLLQLMRMAFSLE